MGNAFQPYRKKMMADYGADGMHGGVPSWEAHMRTPAGKAELRAFAECVQARPGHREEANAQPAQLLRGALCLAGCTVMPNCNKARSACLCMLNRASHACRWCRSNQHLRAARCLHRVQAVIPAALLTVTPDVFCERP